MKHPNFCLGGLLLPSEKVCVSPHLIYLNFSALCAPYSRSCGELLLRTMPLELCESKLSRLIDFVTNRKYWVGILTDRHVLGKNCTQLWRTDIFWDGNRDGKLDGNRKLRMAWIFSLFNVYLEHLDVYLQKTRVKIK